MIFTSTRFFVLLRRTRRDECAADRVASYRKAERSIDAIVVVARVCLRSDCAVVTRAVRKAVPAKSTVQTGY